MIYGPLRELLRVSRQVPYWVYASFFHISGNTFPLLQYVEGEATSFASRAGDRGRFLLKALPRFTVSDYRHYISDMFSDSLAIDIYDVFRPVPLQCRILPGPPILQRLSSCMTVCFRLQRTLGGRGTQAEEAQIRGRPAQVRLRIAAISLESDIGVRVTEELSNLRERDAALDQVDDCRIAQDVGRHVLQIGGLHGGVEPSLDVLTS